MGLSEILQITTSGLLGIFLASTFVLRKNYKELFEKYWELRSENLEQKQRNDLYELYSPENIKEKVNGAAISQKHKPSKGRR